MAETGAASRPEEDQGRQGDRLSDREHAGWAMKGRAHRRVVRRGTEQGDVTGLGADERDPAERTDNDARLRRDIPPHWEPSRRF